MFNVLVVCQFLELPLVDDLPKVGLINEFKSPPIMIVQSDKLDQKNVWKGPQYWGPYLFTTVKLLLLIVMLITYRPLGTVPVVLWISGIFLCIKLKIGPF